MIEVHRFQHPVGQGGFHSAHLRFGQSTFRYVYDCGSEQDKPLARELRDFAEDLDDTQHIDLCVFSHLHDDHVSGVDRLLSAHSVDIAVIPYLHPWERLVLIASACSTRSLTLGRYEFISDTARWLRARGVRGTAFVLPTHSGDSPDPATFEFPNEPNWPELSGREEKMLTVAPLTHLLESHRDEHPGLPRPADDLFVVEKGTALTVFAAPVLAWVLIPYTHSEPEKYREFATEAARVLGRNVLLKPGSNSFFKTLKATLEDRKKRTRLGQAYRHVFGRDLNRTSLSLFSGPSWIHRDFATLREVSHGGGAYHNWHWYPDHFPKVGWIGTGDAPLKTREYARAFGKFFSSAFGRTSTFMLPHHGSKHNFAANQFAA